MRGSSLPKELPDSSIKESNPVIRQSNKFVASRPPARRVTRKIKETIRPPRNKRGASTNAGRPMTHSCPPMPPMAPVANNDHDRSEARQREIQTPQGLRLIDLAMTADVYRTQQEVMNCFDHHQCVVCGGQYTHETLLECPDIPHHRRSAVRNIVRNRGKYKKFALVHGLPAAINAFTNNPCGPQ
jgi:hypothetical protein